MTFQEEKLKNCLDEAKPLLYAHYKEIAHYQDIEFNPDYEMYLKMDEAGIIKSYSVRENGVMIGYAVFFIKRNLHYKKSIQAQQDIVFIKSDKRGCGLFFIKWCDEQLKREGIQVVYHHIKAAHNFGKALERIGYELQDLIYSKRLDK